jgi:hypothetical protein
MKSLFVKQLIQFLRRNETNIGWFAAMLRCMLKHRRITHKTVHGWMESEKKLLAIDGEILEALTAFQEMAMEKSTMWFPEPGLVDAFLQDCLAAMVEKGKVVLDADGLYSLKNPKKKPGKTSKASIRD